MPSIVPADFVRCSDPQHATSPLHDTWILGNDGETYCARELGRRRKTAPPEGPVNKALVRAQKDYKPGDDGWQRHLEDFITRDLFEAPVQATNEETYSLEGVRAAMDHAATFTDPRAPTQPLRRPALLVRNLAAQRMAIALDAEQAVESDYRLPECSPAQMHALHDSFYALLRQECRLRNLDRMLLGRLRPGEREELDSWTLLLNLAVEKMVEVWDAGMGTSPPVHYMFEEIEARLRLQVRGCGYRLEAHWPDAATEWNAEQRYDVEKSLTFYRTLAGSSTALLFADRAFSASPMFDVCKLPLYALCVGFSGKVSDTLAFQTYAITLPLYRNQTTRDTYLYGMGARSAQHALLTLTGAAFGAQLSSMFSFLATHDLPTMAAATTTGAMLGALVAFIAVDVTNSSHALTPRYVVAPPLSSATRTP